MDALLPTVLVVAVLYFGREFFIPVALAILIAFLLGPLVSRLERLRLGRIGSVIAATLVAFAILGGIGYIVVGQMIELGNDLPKYKGHLEEKVMSLRSRKDGPLARAQKTLQELTREMSGPETVTPDGKPALTEVGKEEPTGPGGKERALKLAKPVPVTVVSMPAPPDRNNNAGSPLQTLEDVVSPVLGPLGTAALVIVFVIFMLLDREDLRDRIIHLVGRGHLQVTTQALDDAATRVSRYLIAQTMVNASYGVPIGIGLYFIGIPNAFLFGLLAIVLRFIPYLGSWIASAFPLVLSMAISSGWTTPALTLGLFIVVELSTANIVEPWLYGASTGLSSMAVIAAAAFWTWLWGPVGLLLATPMTVCLAVLGKHIPNLTFLDVLLGDRPPIAPEDRFYQRLLATDEDEVSAIAERYCSKHSLLEAFERLIVPAMRLADEDYHNGALSDAARTQILRIVCDLVGDLGEPEAAKAVSKTSAPAALVCLPASDYADELIGTMLVRLLAMNGVVAEVMPSKMLASEMLEAAVSSPTRLFCISVLPPRNTRQGLYVSKRLRDRLPEARILVGMWGEPASDERGRLARFQRVRNDGLFTSLQDIIKEIMATVPVAAPAPEALPGAEPVVSAPVPA